MPSTFLRAAGVVPSAGLPTLAAMDIAPALSPRPLTGALVQPYAMWNFGPDAASLASLSSGHTAAPLAASVPAYDGVSLTTNVASFAGVDTGIPDQQVGTWWAVFQLTGTAADTGVILGSYAFDGSSAADGWWLYRNGGGGSGRIDISASGASNTGGVLNSNAWPTAGGLTYVAGDWLFAAVASDAQGMEAMMGPSGASRILGQASGTINFPGQPAAGDTVTIGGVAITFVAGGAAGAQVNIGATALATAQAMAAYMNASAGTLGVRANVNPSSSAVTVYAATGGTGGNAITLAKTSAMLTVSGATLANGGATKTVAPRNVAIGPGYTNNASYRSSQRIAEVGFYQGRLTLAQMQALYAETKARLAAQGVAVK